LVRRAAAPYHYGSTPATRRRFIRLAAPTPASRRRRGVVIRIAPFAAAALFGLLLVVRNGAEDLDVDMVHGEHLATELCKE
jgi:hypothetical protein